METPETTSRGVDALIARLRDDGVAAGRTEADRIVSEAQASATELLAAARKEADAYLAEAKRDADNYRRAGEQALETAMRDAVLQMRSGITNRFRSDVERLVTRHTADDETLKQMILELVGRVRNTTEGSDVELVLPAHVIGADEIRERADDIQSGKLTEYVLGLTSEMLRDGVTLHTDAGQTGGIVVRVTDKDVELDLTSEAIGALLLEHLQPRFRAVLEGVIRG